MSSELILYTRAECGLCEVALQLVGQAGKSAQQVDISGDLQLLERYGQRIPVLRLADQELGWPFTLDDVDRLTRI